ncbi:MAG TPA: nucleotide-binding protein [Thermoanaerobaculia bacterium]|nr:nucleotide-binding protein [Thermoanaerobaculia bacterium]
MKDAIARLKALMAEGEGLTYSTFARINKRGYPESFKPEWLTWVARVETLLSRLFGPGAAPMDLLKSAKEVELIGWDSDHFELAKSYFVGALFAGIKLLEDGDAEDLGGRATTAPGSLGTKVFVVHGHDDRAKTELEILIRELGLEPIVLHRQADRGQTLIEKFEANSDVGYAFILLTPDEVAYLKSQESSSDADRIKEKRARPNVIFEFGYFVGKLGRGRVCCLHTGGVTLPSDLAGLVYKAYTDHVEELGLSIVRELTAAGYDVRFSRDAG